MSNYIRNRETLRGAMEVIFGWALYKCVLMEPEGEEPYLEGTHHGTVRDYDAALQWVNGDDDVQILKIYDENGKPFGAVG